MTNPNLIPRHRRRVTPGLFVARDEQKLSLTALAAKVGANPIHLSRVERGLKSPSLDLLERLAEALGVDLDDISTREPMRDAA